MIASLLLALLRIYQRFVSPMLGPACRFTPSCSHYAVGCIQTHGALRGSLLSAVRLCKCHPFHAGGHDPVPPARPRLSSSSGFAEALPEAVLEAGPRRASVRHPS